MYFMLVRYFGNYFWFRFNTMCLGENNDNLSETKKIFSLSARFPSLPQNEKIFA